MLLGFVLVHQGIGSRGRVVRQGSAKALTAVQIRSRPLMVVWWGSYLGLCIKKKQKYLFYSRISYKRILL